MPPNTEPPPAAALGFFATGSDFTGAGTGSGSGSGSAFLALTFFWNIFPNTEVGSVLGGVGFDGFDGLISGSGTLSVATPVAGVERTTGALAARAGGSLRVLINFCAFSSAALASSRAILKACSV